MYYLSKKNMGYYEIYFNNYKKQERLEKFEKELQKEKEDNELNELILHPENKININNDDIINDTERAERIKKLKLKKYSFYDKILNQAIDSSFENKDNLDFIKLDKNSKILFIIRKQEIPIIIDCYYDTLGITKETPAQEIKQNFRKIAIKYHPDKNPSTLAYFTHVCNAYETLIHDKKRADYDDEILLKEHSGGIYLKVGKYKFNVVYIFM